MAAMSDVVLVHFQLTPDLWRAFYSAHYAADRNLRSRFCLGLFSLILGCMVVAGWFGNLLVGWLLLATGLFGVLSRPVLLAKSLRAAARHPFIGQELRVTISREEILVEGTSACYSQPWSSFVQVKRYSPGLAFYMNDNAFFFIPDTALTALDLNKLVRFAEAAEVPVI